MLWTGGNDNIYVQDMKDSQRQPKGKVDIHKILTRGLKAVFVAFGIDTKININYTNGKDDERKDG